MTFIETLYEQTARLAAPAARLGEPFSAKLRRGSLGRRAALPSLREWAGASRDPARPLLWLHAPSVGEALMAQAILAAAREREPRLQAVFTHFSPSAERIAPRVGADWAGYLPWDTAANAHAALTALRPDCVAFVRTELWPALVRAAHAQGVPAVMINAVLASDSSRTGRLARVVLGPAYRRLHAVGAVGDVDAAAFPVLGVEPGRIHVTGDARFDQVWQRVQSLDTEQPLLRALRGAGGPWLVAGSTWPADEERVTAALLYGRTRTAGGPGGWRALVAPHEPDAAHVAGLERRLDAAGLSHMRLPAAADAAGAELRADVVVVDRVGVLADLYAIAAAAYVGGGFGSDGLHSVVEPAALGVPVIYGPRHGNALEATRLARAGGGFVVRSADELGVRLELLRNSAAARAAAGSAARAFVQQQVGAASRNAELILAAVRSAG